MNDTPRMKAAQMAAMEHSTDLGKTWLPCGVVEEAK